MPLGASLAASGREDRRMNAHDSWPRFCRWLGLWCACWIAGELGCQQTLADAVRARLSQHLEQHLAPGMSCAIAVGDQLVFAAGVGEADVENHVPATAATVYRLASISKPITAVLAMQLAERGELDLDQDVHELLPAWPQKRWPVTTRLLLGHLGGVRHYRRGEPESTVAFDDQTSGLGRFAADPLQHQPGTRYLYSTYGFNLVAAVLEARTERPFATLVRERIAVPCGAPSLQDDHQGRIIEHRAQGYERRAGELRNSRLMDSSYKLGGGGLCASAPDLARFAMALLRGELVSEQTLLQMWTEQHATGGDGENGDGASAAGTGYGLGFGVRRAAGRLVVSHSGAQARVSTMLRLEPDRRIVVVVLCNLERVPLGGLTRDLAGLARSAEEQR